MGMTEADDSGLAFQKPNLGMMCIVYSTAKSLRLFGCAVMRELCATY
jgi:hypothetical protein